MRQKIAVTGGLGFIGFNLCKHLIKQFPDISLLVIDDLKSNSKNYFPEKSNIEVINMTISINNKSKLIDIISGCTSIIHLAAKGNVTESISSPWNNFENNVISTLVLLEVARTAGIKQFLFSSTGGAIMGNTLPPVDERSLPQPISPYGSSKLACEGYIRSYSMCYGINTIIFRFGNVYGKHSMHKTGIINKTIISALKNESITIRGDGSSTRDYIHVDDICNGIIKGISFISSLGEGSCNLFHLANGIETSLNELITTIEGVHGAKINRQHVEEITGEVRRNAAMTSAASSMLNFKTSISLEKGIKSLYDWIRNEI